MTAPMNCQLVGRWRIVEADLWDRDHLDLVEPGHDDHSSGWPRRDRLRRHAGQPRPRIQPLHGLLHLGRVRTKWTTSTVPARLSCSTTGRSKSSSPTISATKPSSRPNPLFLQQAAKRGGDRPRHVGCVLRPVARARHRAHRGASAYFTHVNRAGGVRGRKIVLKTHDDGYQPDPSVANTLTLMLEDQVFALFGYVGTPTVTRVLPMLKKFQERNVYLFFPFTGAQPQREPPYGEFAFNLRASYRQETAGWSIISSPSAGGASPCSTRPTPMAAAAGPGCGGRSRNTANGSSARPRTGAPRSLAAACANRSRF